MPSRHSLAPDRSRRSGTSVEDAEAQTGVTKQQVSKWRRRLKEPEKYRAMLYGFAYAKAIVNIGFPVASGRPQERPLSGPL